MRIDPARMVGEVANGKADVAVGFAPDVARYVKAHERQAEDGRCSRRRRAERRREGAVPLRSVDRACARTTQSLLDEIDAALVKARPKIEEILKEEGVPAAAGVDSAKSCAARKRKDRTKSKCR